LDLRHNICWDRPYLYARLLLAHQSIYYVQYLIGKAGLAYRSNTCCSREWPKDKHPNCTNRSLVDPLLLANHRQRTARYTLQCNGERRLHADQGFKVAALLQLDQYLVLAADLLHLVILRSINIF
jgi:hypothetical protein